MGRDIHTFIEVIIEDFVWTHAEVTVSRHSDLFRIIDKLQPKGLPENISDTVHANYFLRVVDTEEEQSWAGSEYITKAEAEAWISKGNSYYRKDQNSEDIWVSWLGLVGASWLTLEEVEEVVNEYMKCEHKNFEFLVLVDTMRSLEKHMGEGSSRLIYWFDV